MAAPSKLVWRTLRRTNVPGRCPWRHVRTYAMAAEPGLKTVLKEVIPEKRELLQQVKSKAKTVIGEVAVENTLGGMRGLTALVWEGSVLDPNEGIRFHGRTIADCLDQLPGREGSGGMYPEAMFWLLLTGRIPSSTQVRNLSRELAEKSVLEPRFHKIFEALPEQMHPMTQLSIMVSALGDTSEFARAYKKGINKTEYWEHVFDDCISLIAKLPTLASLIYNRAYSTSWELPTPDSGADWALNFAAMLRKGGRANVNFQDLLRLYLALHGDHEGGNVSAHATHLVGSALSDPFLSYSAGLQGLAGPLHGLAAQEVLTWLQQMMAAIPDEPSDDDIATYLRKTLESGRVIPGYGHGVLRRPDPRFQTLVDFSASRSELASDPQFTMVQRLSEIAPMVLKEHGKTKNPYPNVDSVSGVLFHRFGFTNPEFYTVIFGVSRSLGPLAQLIWSRILGFPIERPKSINMEGLLAKVSNT